mgnify:CR=1 FL=1
MNGYSNHYKHEESAIFSMHITVLEFIIVENAIIHTFINYKDVVTRVNIKLDLPVYTDTKEVEDGNDYLVLVNKYNHLPKNYRPTDLAYIPGAYGNNVPMRSITKDAFLELQDAAKKELNINLMPTTAFRDEAFQRTLYTNYVNKEGVDKADTYSARPGYSEHQTGLSIDLKNTALSNVRLSDENYDWLENNAYKYGFIIRFPKNKEDITLYLIDQEEENQWQELKAEWTQSRSTIRY